MALLILVSLQATWLGGQQQPVQLEHESGAEQFSHEVSTQPQDWQDMGAIDMRDSRMTDGPTYQNSPFRAERVPESGSLLGPTMTEEGPRGRLC